MKRRLSLPILLLCLLFLPILPAAAETAPLSLTITDEQGKALTRLTDGSGATAQSFSGGRLELQSSENISAVYIVFDEICTDWGIVTPEGNRPLGENGFLHAYSELSSLLPEQTKTANLYFNGSSKICEIYAFADKALPDWVQIWQPPCEKADLMLFSTHSDDEQLFFAGLLPYYAGERELAVQVAYFTNHNNQPSRRHEQLNGLWAVGVRHYPSIGKLPDLYADSKASALKNWAQYGFSEQDIVASQTELLRRFQPQVVVAHDIAGEYGHGAHILNTHTLLQALRVSNDENRFPESAKAHGVYKPKKVYIHLYENDPITMNWDVPLAGLGGKTAYEVSREGFACHTSQHWTWFSKWLLGTDARPITTASQIKTYSPCKFGLYATEVGADTASGDLFEHLTSYSEQEAQAKAEQEKRIKEEKCLAQEKQEKETAAQKKQTLRRVFALSAGSVILLALATFLWLRLRAKGRRRKDL